MGYKTSETVCDRSTVLLGNNWEEVTTHFNLALYCATLSACTFHLDHCDSYRCNGRSLETIHVYI